MNIHPALVHFPIALLFLYTLIELIPFARFMPSVPWDAVRRFLLYIGTLGAALAAVTGIMAEDVVGESSKIEPHEETALTLVGLFILLSVLVYFWRSESVLKTWILKLLALGGLVLLFAVGALGANIVYGSSVDPIAAFVAGIFGVR